MWRHHASAGPRQQRSPGLHIEVAGTLNDPVLLQTRSAYRRALQLFPTRSHGHRRTWLRHSSRSFAIARCTPSRIGAACLTSATHIVVGSGDGKFVAVAGDASGKCTSGLGLGRCRADRRIHHHVEHERRTFAFACGSWN